MVNVPEPTAASPEVLWYMNTPQVLEVLNVQLFTVTEFLPSIVTASEAAAVIEVPVAVIFPVE